MSHLHEVTVRRIGDGWNIRVFYLGKLTCEYRCYSKLDIGYTCRQALRDCDKFYTGGDKFTSSVRKRMWNKEKYPQLPVKPIRKIY